MKIVIIFEISVANVNTEQNHPKRFVSEKQFDSIYKAVKTILGFAAVYLLKAIISTMLGS